MLNKEVAKINKHHKRLQPHNAYKVGEMIVVQYSVFETRNDEFNKAVKVIQYIDHITMERPLEEYSDNGRILPKIKMRQWSELKMPLKVG